MEAQEAEKTTTPSLSEKECPKNGHDRSDSYLSIIPKLPEVPKELPLRGRRNATAHDTLDFALHDLSPERALPRPGKAPKDSQAESSSYEPWVHEALGLLNQAKQDDIKHKEVFRQLQETIATFGLYTSPLENEVRRIESMMRKHFADAQGCMKVDRAIEDALNG